MPITTDSIRTYYDQNTDLFLTFSGSKKAQNIHRTLWMSDTKTLEDALNTSNAFIKAVIESVTPKNASIADLGCGVARASSIFIRVCKAPLPPLD